MDNGLIFYAPFDGATVNLVEWVKPRHHGVRYVADKFGRPNRAVAFAGQGNYLDYGNILSLDEKNFSFSLWVAVDLPATSGQLLGKGSVPFVAGSYGLTTTGDPITGLKFCFSTERGKLVSSFSPEIKFGEWHHLVVTRDALGTQFFLNGQLINESLGGGSEVLHNQLSFILGASLDQYQEATSFFNGRMDEVRIYNRKLTKREIELLFTQFQFVDGIAPIGAPATGLHFTPYPNPTTRVLNIDFPSIAFRRMEIVDGSGRLIRYFRSESQRIELPVAGLPPGNYFLRVIENGKTSVKQFVKTGAVIP
ncbi:MAG: LamG-like jellyroll fold domain-containing protein [Bacteroidota bacterium]